MMDFFEDEPEINEHGKPCRKHNLWWEIEYWGCMIGISVTIYLLDHGFFIYSFSSTSITSKADWFVM